MRDSADEARIVDLKEARPSATTALLPAVEDRWASEAHRTVAAAGGLLREPPRQLTAVVSGARSFTTRTLFPQEDKLRLDQMPTGPRLDAIVQCIGRLLGAAHARGATSRPDAPWSAAEVAGLVDRAIEMAGIFESVYLAYAR